MDNLEVLYKGFHPDAYGKEFITLDGKQISGRWLEGSYLHYDVTTYCFKEDGPSPHKHLIVFTEMVDWGLPNRVLQGEVIPETVGQYSGHTDKNGRKIFKGDLVKFSYGNKEQICEVVFENGAFGLGVEETFDYSELEKAIEKTTENKPYLCFNDNFISLWELAWNFNEYAGEGLSSIEVLGNKYSNPVSINFKEIK